MYFEVLSVHFWEWHCLKWLSCPDFWENDAIFNDYLTSFTVFLEILKKKREKSSEKKRKKKLWKKKRKKSSENDQSTGHFQSFFISFFFVPPTLDLKKNSPKSTNKKIWPNIKINKYAKFDPNIPFVSRGMSIFNSNCTRLTGLMLSKASTIISLLYLNLYVLWDDALIS